MTCHLSPGRAACLAVLFTLTVAQCGPVLEPAVVSLESGIEELLIGISPVSDSVVWVSGTGGTFGRTVDGGESWDFDVVAGADSLQFRDVHAVNRTTAYLLSIGSGDRSRVYKTVDEGQTWDLQFVNPEPQGFFDCFDFWDARSGMAFSDSFDGSFYIIKTEDGGQTWTQIDPAVLPPAREGEGSFAASGLCLQVQGDSTAWIGTGASEQGNARVLQTRDRGQSWTYSDTPIPGGAMSGLTSVAMMDLEVGAALGGVVMDMESAAMNVAVTEDGGATWTMTGRPSFPGPVYGAVYVPGTSQATLVAVGPMGVAYSVDHGASWVTLSEEDHWSVGFASAQAGWAIGPEGRISKISLYK